MESKYLHVYKALTPTERRYAQIEKEALAILNTVERLQQYLVGMKFTIITDHKPLLSLLTTKPINELTPRLQRIRMRLTHFAYNIVHVPGKELYAADALSRIPKVSEEESEQFESTTEIYSVSAKVGDVALKDLQTEDNTTKLLMKYTMEGWPDSKRQLQVESSPFYKHRFDMALHNNVLSFKDRVLIPAKQ